MPDSPRTIVYTHGGGRFGNQLMIFGHLIGLASEYPDLHIVDYSFWPYAGYCAGTENNPRCEFPPRRTSAGPWVTLERAIRGMVWKRRKIAANRVIGQALHKGMPWRSMNYVGSSREIRLSDPTILAQFRSRTVTYLAGWHLRDWELFEKHQDAIRAFLKPATKFQAVADKLIGELRAKHDMIVGVLIRQDDYRQAFNGEFFYPSEQYRTWLAQLRERFGPRAAILIATDEKQPAGIYDDIGVAWCTGEKAGSGHYLESFLELSMCDVVVSVPSTFSVWSAFYGAKPILPIGTASDDLRQVPLMPGHLFDALKEARFARSMM